MLESQDISSTGKAYYPSLDGILFTPQFTIQASLDHPDFPDTIMPLQEYLVLCQRSIRGKKRIKALIRRRKKVFERSQGCCVWCQEKFDSHRANWNLDHIIPSSRGVGNSVDNLLVSCYQCNHSRGNRSPYRWSKKIRQYGKGPRVDLIIKSLQDYLDQANPKTNLDCKNYATNQLKELEKLVANV
jgi:hypothetical protein